MVQQFHTILYILEMHTFSSSALQMGKLVCTHLTFFWCGNTSHEDKSSCVVGAVWRFGKEDIPAVRCQTNYTDTCAFLLKHTRTNTSVYLKARKNKYGLSLRMKSQLQRQW